MKSSDMENLLLILKDILASLVVINILFFALAPPNLNPTKCLYFNKLVFNPGHAKSPRSIAKHLIFHEHPRIAVHPEQVRPPVGSAVSPSRELSPPRATCLRLPCLRQAGGVIDDFRAQQTGSSFHPTLPITDLGKCVTGHRFMALSAHRFIGSLGGRLKCDRPITRSPDHLIGSWHHRIIR